MRYLLILTPLLMAQGVPRPFCAYGEGLSALTEVERASGLPVPGVNEGRARGEAAVAALGGAANIFAGCGCPRLVEMTREALTVAQSAPSEPSAARLGQVFAQIRFRTQLVRDQAERQGCR